MRGNFTYQDLDIEPMSGVVVDKEIDQILDSDMQLIFISIIF